MARKQQTALAAKVVTALRRLQADPGTKVYRDAATAIIELRRSYTHQGMPDWTGRGIEYRDVIERLYRQAEMPPDSAGSHQANLRYHIGNVLRETAPAEDLQALGLTVQGPLGRAREARESVPRLSRATTEGLEPQALAKLALDAVQTLRRLAPEDDGLRPVLRKLVSETVDALGELR